MKKIKLLISALSCFLLTPSFATSLVTPPQTTSISSNPAAVNIVNGTGAAQQYLEKRLGIHNDHGVRFGGAWIADTNILLSGGVHHPKRWTSNDLFLLSLTVDTKKAGGWQGGMFGIEFLQLNAQDTNGQSGSLQGYNSIPGSKPLNRSELYQLWYRQEFFDQKFVLRIGKVVPTFDFGNVIKPVSLSNEKLFIPVVSGLIFTPLYVNPTMLGVMPGYYNSTYGVTMSLAPIKEWYINYGVYDGNLARGTQTGKKVSPTWNGSYFHIGETGVTWLLGKNAMPGNIGVGLWHQAGLIVSSPVLTEQQASGFYMFGAQRLWYRHPGEDAAGISMYYQYGINNSNVLPFKKYVGGCFTAFGLTPQRIDDSMGIGAALSWLNQKSFNRPTELILQAYYQAKVINGVYLEPALSYIPTPGAGANLPAAWAGTLRAIVLF